MLVLINQQFVLICLSYTSIYIIYIWNIYGHMYSTNCKTSCFNQKIRISSGQLPAFEPAASQATPFTSRWERSKTSHVDRVINQYYFTIIGQCLTIKSNYLPAIKQKSYSTLAMDIGDCWVLTHRGSMVGIIAGQWAQEMSAFPWQSQSTYPLVT